jgi:hypothetical protein
MELVLGALPRGFSAEEPSAQGSGAVSADTPAPTAPARRYYLADLAAWLAWIDRSIPEEKYRLAARANLFNPRRDGGLGALAGDARANEPPKD